MAVSQDTAEFQIVPSDSRLSRTHSRPHYARDPSSSTPSYAVSPDSRATIIEVRNKTTACGPLPVMEESGEGGLSSSGAMSASLPTPSDVATSSTGDKQELGLSSARMKRRESRKSKTRGPREVNQKPSLGASVKEGELAAHNAQQAGDAAVVGGGGEVVHELVKSGNAAGKKRLQKKKAASREDPAPPQQEEDVDGGAQSHQQNLGEDAVVDYPLERSEKLIQSVTAPHSSLSPPLRSVTPAPDDEPVLSVTIHHCTALQPHSSLRHPLVKVHFVNTSTGEYLLKPDRRRRVVSYYETEHQGVDYVLPAATQPCNLRTQKKPFTPVWEETLVINEVISSIVMPSTVAIFEVLDFVDFSSVSQWSSHTNPVSRDYSGWFKVAWAFLQVFVNSFLLAVGKDLRVEASCR